MKIIIIGAGPGGYETAIEAARRGIEVILIEAGNVGGTCLNEGCIPTKVLCRSAEVLEEVRAAEDFGICFTDPLAGHADMAVDKECACDNAESAAREGSGASDRRIPIDFGKVRQRKSQVVEQLRSGVMTLLDNRLITLIHGRAVLKDAHSVTVYSPAMEYTADRIIVASGSHASPLRIPGGDLPGLMTSREMLETDHVPETLCIIGAGVIGLEFASVFNSFGSRVTVIEYCGQILPRSDSDLAKRLKQSMSKRGIEIIVSAAVKSISHVRGTVAEDTDANAGVSGRDGGEPGYRVEYECKGKILAVTAEKVLVAVGRCPNVEGLGLDNAGVKYSAKGISVDDNMQTSCPTVYAIGDVTGKVMLAHAAVSQGLRALNHICGQSDRIDLSLVPSAVFTMPEAASVGLTEDECRERGIACKAVKSFFRANGKAVAMGQTDGFVKTVVAVCPADVPDKTVVTESDGSPRTERTDGPRFRDGQILGCHLFGPHASDLISEMTALISRHATLEDLRGIIHAHPTLSEVFR